MKCAQGRTHAALFSEVRLCFVAFLKQEKLCVYLHNVLYMYVQCRSHHRHPTISPGTSWLVNMPQKPGRTPKTLVRCKRKKNGAIGQDPKKPSYGMGDLRGYYICIPSSLCSRSREAPYWQHHRVLVGRWRCMQMLPRKSRLLYLVVVPDAGCTMRASVPQRSTPVPRHSVHA